MELWLKLTNQPLQQRRRNSNFFDLPTIPILDKFKSIWTEPNKLQIALAIEIYCLTTNSKNEIAAHAATNAARDEAYLRQITQATTDLNPGAKLYYLQGIDHFTRLSPQLNKLNTFFIDPDISAEKEEL